MNNEDEPPLLEISRVELDKNNINVTLRVVRGDRKGTQCLGYNWTNLFLGDINTETLPSRLEESQMRQ
jgi:hypothetical protein